MSSPVSVMKGAVAEGQVTVTDMGPSGMITLRGDLKSGAIAKVVKSVTGATVPTVGQIETKSKGACGWMSPDELLILTEYDGAEAVSAKITKALAKEHHLAVNVSDARSLFKMTGTGIRDLLAQGSPADVSEGALPLGMLRRTRFGQLPVAFWMTAQDEAYLICFRSVSEHVFKHLVLSARSLPEDPFH